MGTKGDIAATNGTSKKLECVVKIVERVGFPVVICFLIMWYQWTTVDKLTIAVQQNTKVMQDFSTFLVEFRHSVQAEHMEMLKDLQKLRP